MTREQMRTDKRMQAKFADKIVHQRVDALVPYARNSRTHSDEQVAQIAASIREFGFTNPVLVDDQGGIVAGHGRVLAAKQIGMDTVPTICVGWLSEKQRRAYVIADNQLALNAGWDDAVLASELDDLLAEDFDLQLIGFDPETLDDILAGANNDSAAGAEPAETSAGINYQEKFAVLVDCKNESDQRRVFDKLTTDGLSCKVLVN